MNFNRILKEKMTDSSVVSNGMSNESHSSSESPWQQKKVKVSAENLELQAKVMAKEGVCHSGYVPAQLERHLEFMNFNSGMIFNLEFSDPDQKFIFKNNSRWTRDFGLFQPNR